MAATGWPFWRSFVSETDTNECRSAGYGAAAMAEAPYLRTVRAAYDAIAEGYAERFAA